MSLHDQPNFKCSCGLPLVRHEGIAWKRNKKHKVTRIYFWGCTGHPACTIQIPDKNGVPNIGKRLFKKIVRVDQINAVYNANRTVSDFKS